MNQPDPADHVQRKIEQRLRELIEPARQRPGFMERLRKRIEQDKPILDRLKSEERPDA